VRLDQLPLEVREHAASLQLPSSAIEPLLVRLVDALERRLGEPTERVLDAWRARDALLGREISWETHNPSGSSAPGTRPNRPKPSPPDRVRAGAANGRAQGVDDSGRLIVALADGSTTTLDSGEVHLGRAG
jgi:BirA family biotin operon repressor/biotin-[acetyl-CoA-carboxylase] ligase